MEDSVPGVPNGSVHIADLSESKELCIEVADNKAMDAKVASEEITEERPLLIIGKQSGVDSFDEDSKILLSKIAECLGLDVLDKVSEKLSKGTRGKETSAHDEDDRLAFELNLIEESIDSISHGKAPKKPNLVTGQLADTLKGFAGRSNKSTYTDQLTRVVEKLTKKCREYRRRRDLYEFMSHKTEDSLQIPSDSDSATASSLSDFRRLSRANENVSRSYASHTSTSTGSESLDNRHRDNRSGSSRGPKHHLEGRLGPLYRSLERVGSPKHGRRCVSTSVTEGTTTASSTETETGTPTESSIVSWDTVVPTGTYGLRPRKSVDREERDYENFLYYLRRSNEADMPVGILKKVLEAFAKQDGASTEEDLFCEYLKVRLGQLVPKDKRKVIYKMHQVLEQSDD